MKLCNRTADVISKQKASLGCSDIVGNGFDTAIRFRINELITAFYEGDKYSIRINDGSDYIHGDNVKLDDYRSSVLFDELSIDLLNGIHAMVKAHRVGVDAFDAARITLGVAYHLCKYFNVPSIKMSDTDTVLLVGREEYSVVETFDGYHFASSILSDEELAQYNNASHYLENFQVCLAAIIAEARGAKAVTGLIPLLNEWPAFKVIRGGLSPQKLGDMYHLTTTSDGKRHIALDTKKKALVRFVMTSGGELVRDNGKTIKASTPAKRDSSRYEPLVPHTSQVFKMMSIIEQFTVMFKLMDFLDFTGDGLTDVKSDELMPYLVLSYTANGVTDIAELKGGQFALLINNRAYYWCKQYNEFVYKTEFEVTRMIDPNTCETCVLIAAGLLGNLGETTYNELASRVTKKALRAISLLTGA